MNNMAKIIYGNTLFAATIDLLLQGSYFSLLLLVQFSYGSTSSTEDWTRMYQVMARGYSDLNHSTIFRRLSQNIAGSGWTNVTTSRQRHGGHGGHKGFKHGRREWLVV
jgi:hypothetical protein